MSYDKKEITEYFDVEDGKLPFVRTAERQMFLQNPCTSTAVGCVDFATYMNYPITPTTQYEKDKYSEWLFEQGMYLPCNVDVDDDYVECTYEIDDTWKN